MTINIPQKAEQILHILNEAGYEAYVVGGCVRDSILDRVPGDWDITTSALPEQVKELFHRTVDTGIQHGTVTVMMGKEGFEVTTYRVDGEYHDGRHPDAVTFTRSLEEDLKRRDFTINAMAYHPGHGLVDLFGGMEDINRKIIRCVGDPVERFTEDALRMLRAVRFSAQLGFTVEENTKAALARMSGNLEHVSAERIQTELVKLLVSDHPDYLRTAWETGLTREFLPEFDACMETAQNTPHHCCSVGEHILKSLTEIENDRLLRIFHAVDPSDRIFPAEAAYMDHFLCSHSLKSHPAVRPGIIHVCLIPGLHTGWDQKCFSTCQMILMAIHLKNSASGFHDMKYMRDPFIWSKSMSRIAFFPPTISKTEIHRTFL